MAWNTVTIFGLILLIGNIGAVKHPNILGGDAAVIKHFPFLVSLRLSGVVHFCDGSIITDRHVLTAAHCINETLTNFVTVHTGTSRSNKKGSVHKIQSVHIHPKFNIKNEHEGFPYDVGVITLKEPITFNKYQQKVNLPSHDIHDHHVGFVVGWGRTTNENWDSPKQLQKLRVAFMTSDKCKPLLKHHVDHRRVCIFRNYRTGVCHGDSGGPLVSHGEVVGIASFIDSKECASGVPDVYVNVFAYKDFIESVLNGSISAKVPKIIGGEAAVIKQFPFLVSIREAGEHNCGGSIITDRHILTAAHCSVFVNKESLTIHSGISRTDKKGTVHEILSIHNHPNFELYTGKNDISVLTLKHPIDFNKYQQKINLPSHDIEKYQAAYAVGWGRMSTTNWDSANQLQKLRVALVPSDQCQPLLTYIQVNASQVCIFRSDNKGVCNGDSGGPLVSHDAVVGIASMVESGECAGGVPDIYTNVFPFRDFIESIINDKNI